MQGRARKAGNDFGAVIVCDNRLIRMASLKSKGMSFPLRILSEIGFLVCRNISEDLDFLQVLKFVLKAYLKYEPQSSYS